MKVLALNSSVRKSNQSKTELMLNHLTDGMQQAGARVDTINLREKEIKPCIGCFTCWSKTPGQCLHDDDMQRELFPLWRAADLVIYATPLYHHTVNGLMKTFLERTLPAIEPFLIPGTGRWSHPLRHKVPDVVALSVAGFPSDTAFDALSHYMHYLCGDKIRLVAEIYRNGSEFMTKPFCRDRAHDVLAAVCQAGKELVQDCAISAATRERIRQPLMDNPDEMARVAYLAWKSMIQARMTPEVFEKKERTPEPRSLEDFMLLMRLGFNPDAAEDLEVVLQFEFQGAVEGVCHLGIRHGNIVASSGSGKNPDLIIRSPFDTWVAIQCGEADGAQLFMDGAYSAEGDINLLLRLGELFGRARNHP
jgi:multimeric flavodoxin WrbA/putative sterol carrier protein